MVKTSGARSGSNGRSPEDRQLEVLNFLTGPQASKGFGPEGVVVGAAHVGDGHGLVGGYSGWRARQGSG